LIKAEVAQRFFLEIGRKNVKIGQFPEENFSEYENPVVCGMPIMQISHQTKCPNCSDNVQLIPQKPVFVCD